MGHKAAAPPHAFMQNTIFSNEFEFQMSRAQYSTYMCVCVFVYIHARAREPKRIGIRCTGSDGGDTRFENPRACATVIITVTVRGGPTVADYRLDENNFYLYTMLLNYNTYMYALVCI